MACFVAALLLILAFSGIATANDLSNCTNGAGAAAIASCTRALKSHKIDRNDRARVLNARGILWKKQGEYDRAIADYTAALELNPKYYYALNNRGNSYSDKRDFERAIADYSAAIRLNPKFKKAYYNRGIAWKHKGNYDFAIADFDAAIRLDPKYSKAYHSRGRLFLEEKQNYDRAIASFNMAIRFDPGNKQAYNNRGVAWKNKGEYDLAIADYDAALRLDQNYVSAYINRGVAFRHKGDNERALAEYAKALRLDPQNADVHNNRAVLLGNGGDLDGAISEYSNAIRLNPKFLRAFTNRAFTYERKGAFAEALADLRSALAIDPSKHELDQDIRRIEQKLLKQTASVSTPLTEPRPTPPPESLPVQRERRVALVIGNSSYENAPPLANPANDATDITATLRRIGFDVITGNNLDRRAMETKVREFSRAIETADLSLFYYAGHGLQVAGRNYLVPIDAKIEREGDLNFEAIDVDVVLQQLEHGVRANLIFLDACRNNPYARNLERALGIRSAAVGAGLASIQGGVGTMIVYATQPNNIALDGGSRNSPFAAALLSHLPDPGVDVSIMLRRVRADVIHATNQKQVPWDHSSLVGEIVLVRE